MLVKSWNRSRHCSATAPVGIGIGWYHGSPVSAFGGGEAVAWEPDSAARIACSSPMSDSTRFCAQPRSVASTSAACTLRTSEGALSMHHPLLWCRPASLPTLHQQSRRRARHVGTGGSTLRGDIGRLRETGSSADCSGRYQIRRAKERPGTMWFTNRHLRQTAARSADAARTWLFYEGIRQLLACVGFAVGANIDFRLGLADSNQWSGGTNGGSPLLAWQHFALQPPRSFFQTRRTGKAQRCRGSRW